MLLNKTEIEKKFFEAKINNKKNLFIHPPFDLEQHLISWVTKGHYEEAKYYLDEINSLERAKLAKDSVRSLKNSLICSCTIFTRSIIRGGVDPETAFDLSDVFIQQIEKTNTIESLSKLEYDMLLEFIKKVKSNSNRTYQLVVNKAINYINDQIMQPLSLEIISKNVKVHPNYLSKLFKDEIGMTITEFINRKRIEESKYFLLHSELAISEIAHLFTYCNQSYYSSLFKKYTSISPKQFMKLQHKKTD
ncbi:AraC family transcriptional regulator [Lottiidibacillus patelloidae]|uniref:AraC family transcriptional regulator n=1 Tax=Lottiidibacillus patelloidae TaxID=2670334 RepID=A0A263BRM2_9BACI|nr:AraC family transcriptional regulator [Lottiidibacillus patelloidae]OZM56345.1 AraC family transcriptional regulator [Lottiidibacillus patelloidae]